MQDPKQKLNQKKRKLKAEVGCYDNYSPDHGLLFISFINYNITHYLQDSSLDTDTAATPYRSSKQAWQKERWKKVDAHV